MEPIISVRELGKMYRIRSQDTKPYRTLREELVEGVQKLWQGKFAQPKMEEFWAIKDINFDIYPGEVVGIIGRNGAGKSTLLKILSRITPPTTGEAILRGRVGSLLEVGTGFHPELTGRENIYLSGAILGMSKAEIKNKFDEIVAFAEVEKFIDNPVKRYSSGMYVRLAFAVAAHLEPDILLVDEVLAVGDAAFQKKCLGKMGEVGKEGRTVVFVSHDMRAIRMLCKSGLLMISGKTSGKQDIESLIANYSFENYLTNNVSFPVVTDEVIIYNFKVSQNSFCASEYDAGQPIDLEIDFEIKKNLTLFRMGVYLKSSLGDVIFRSFLEDWNPSFTNLIEGHYLCKGQIPKNFMAGGNYILELHSSRYGIRDYGFTDLLNVQLTIKPPLNFNSAYIGEPPSGIVILDSHWTLNRVQS